MKELILEQIKKRAELNGGDFGAAAEQYFHDHGADAYRAYNAEVTIGATRTEDVAKLDNQIEGRLKYIALREGLNIETSNGRTAATIKLIQEDPHFYREYTRATVSKIGRKIID